jgi:hypothetical protein
VTVLDLPRPQQTMRDRCWTLALPRPSGADPLLGPEMMTAAEQMFFFGAPLAHVVQFEEHLRLTRQEQAARRLLRCRGLHDFSRQLPAGAEGRGNR